MLARTVIEVAGADRLGFLNGLLTCNIVPGRPLTYGALLTPQGKVITDLFVHERPDAFYLDVPESAADDLVRRLTVYKLRAAVAVARTDRAITLAEGPDDPRGSIGQRGLADAPAGDAHAYAAARIAAGAPDAVTDYPLSEMFPHEVNMDLTGGVDFAKGCFVGQEVVSRMRHRGTARRRTVIVTADAPLATAAAVTADGRTVGTLGTPAGAHALAVVRIDRVGANAHAGGAPVHLAVPPNATFALMADDDAAGGGGQADADAGTAGA